MESSHVKRKSRGTHIISSRSSGEEHLWQALKITNDNFEMSLKQEVNIFWNLDLDSCEVKDLLQHGGREKKARESSLTLKQDVKIFLEQC